MSKKGFKEGGPKQSLWSKIFKGGNNTNQDKYSISELQKEVEETHESLLTEDEKQGALDNGTGRSGGFLNASLTTNHIAPQMRNPNSQREDGKSPDSVAAAASASSPLLQQQNQNNSSSNKGLEKGSR